MKRYLNVAFFLFIFLCTVPVSAEAPSPPGRIDWLNGKIQAMGVAYPQKKDTDTPPNPSKMLSVAKVVAQNNLLKKIKNISVSSTQRVDMIFGSDPLFMAKIQSLIKNAPVISQAYLSDGTLEVAIEMGLWGAFSQLVLPLEVKPIEAITSLNPPGAESKIRSNVGRWTGLIVDARGLDLQPAMVPSITDDLGSRVYGAEFINRDFAVQWGMCGYIRGLDERLRTDRVGVKPIMVKAIRTSGPHRTDIVISTADAGRIRAFAEHVALLREGRMIVVTD